MIVLDTNVLSELMRPQVDPAIGDWINRFSQGDLFITAITRAEIERGLNLPLSNLAWCRQAGNARVGRSARKTLKSLLLCWFTV